MHTFSISASYPIQRISQPIPMHGVAEANLTLYNDGQPVVVSIVGQEQYAKALVQDFAISDSLVEWIRSAPGFINCYPPEQAKEIKAISTLLEFAARTAVEAIKYFLNRPDFADNVLGMVADFSCIDEANVRYAIPIPISGFMTGHSGLALDQKTLIDLQSGLDAEYRPLAGMRHLFRAMQEDEPRFRWIDTTIALELSIKEALIRKRPEIETLLLEMPSPPLDKLYGSIMKETFGTLSPYLKIIREGIAKRNKLVHRPTGVAVTKEEAAEYLQVAHKAIQHLFSLLYPNWPIAQQMPTMIFHG